MFSYIWPITLVIIANTVYQICAKSVPGNISPFASLTVTYLVAAAVSTLMFYLTEPSRELWANIAKTNWSSYTLGLVIVGLEVGFIYSYKAGWEISTASLVQSAFVAIALLVVGAVLYHEGMSWNKLLGVGICMLGLFFINMK